jgi:hypothetical protein
MPVSWLPITMFWPVKPIAQSCGAFTLTTPGSTASGARRLLVTPVFATFSSSIHFEASFASMAATSERAARSFTSDAPPRVKITFATQYDWYGTPRLWSSLMSGACVLAACSLSVR